MAGAARLHPDDFAVAFLDDLYVRTTKERARAACDAVTAEVEEHAGVRTHLGKLRAWCRGGGAAPPGLATLGREVWTADRREEENGLQILGTPVGTAAYVEARARERLEEEKRLLQELPELFAPRVHAAAARRGFHRNAPLGALRVQHRRSHRHAAAHRVAHQDARVDRVPPHRREDVRCERFG